MRSTVRLVIALASSAAVCACSPGPDTGGGDGALVGFGDVIVDVEPTYSSLFGFFDMATEGAAGGGGGCDVQTFGACTVQDCSSLGGGGGAPPSASAGTLSVKTGALSITAMPMSDGNYDQTGAAVQPWSDGGGEDVEILATGGVAPSFDMHLRSPGIVHVATPVFPVDPSASTQVSTSDDLQITWTGGAAGASMSIILQENGGSGLVFTDCELAPQAGHATVLAGALAWLEGKNGSISISVSTTTTSTLHGWQVSASAFSSGVGPQGQAASSFDVDFQ